MELNLSNSQDADPPIRQQQDARYAQQPQVTVQGVQTLSPAGHSFDHQHMQQGEQPHLLDPPQRHVHAEAGEAILPTQRPEIRPGHTQIHHDYDGHDSLNRLALLAHPMQPVEDDNENGSYGTLMLSKEGQSKYLGPTAGSEWLKDVGHMAPMAPNKLKYSSRKRKMCSRHRQSLVLHLPE
jgi:hypothetical protein